MEFISDVIGEDYKKWKYHETIFISAPTGKGKSYFVLHDLLKNLIDNPRWINQNGIYKCEKILYLVNRKILKSQIEEEIKKMESEDSLYYKLQNLQVDIFDFIKVMTYQTIEKALKNPYSQNSYILYNLTQEPYKYIIYDECHYFSVDSTYNTYTELSYDFLRNTYFKRVQIFLSATMDSIKGLLENRKECFPNNQNVGSQFKNLNMFTHSYNYSIPADYSNVTVRVIKDEEVLKELIISNSLQKDEKWLIFVDSISGGKKLKEELSNYMEKEDKKSIVFIDARYKEEEIASETVNQIAAQNYSSAKILIATSVMDNGISIKDIELRNMVIMADTKDEFIQMIGRKRFGHEEDNIIVYIIERDIGHFIRRYRYYDEVLSFYNTYKNKLTNNNSLLSQYVPEEDVNDLSKQPYTLNLCDLYNFSYCVGHQQKPLEQILEDNKIAKILTYSYYGKLNFNHFAVDRCRYLRGFYQQTIEELKKDQHYFIKLQYLWLDKIVNDTQIQYVFEEEIKIHKDKIMCEIEQSIDKELDKERNIELKDAIKDDVKNLLKISGIENEDVKKLFHRLDNKNNTISQKDFNSIMEWIDLNYQMKKPDNSTFVITKKKD